MYIPDEWLLWDFWFAPKTTGEPFHLYHLQAPRSLEDPDQRHVVAEIGHAISDDLVNWRRVGTAISRGKPDSWDDRAIWTGCTVYKSGLYYLFYTAISTTDRGLVQRIGLATSPDQLHWTKHPHNPIMTADSLRYETERTNPQHDEAFRDPFVYYDETVDSWFMLFCARTNFGPDDERGVVGFAVSDDLIRWTQIGNLFHPGEFGQLEVPQMVTLGEERYIVFCTGQHSARRLARTGETGNWIGTHYLIEDGFNGEFKLGVNVPLVGDGQGTYYAGRIETELTGEPLFFAWRQYDDDGNFVGGLSNPVPVTVNQDGTLAVNEQLLWVDPE